MTQQDGGQLGEEEAFQKAVGNADQNILQQLGLDEPLNVSSGELCSTYFDPPNHD